MTSETLNTCNVTEHEQLVNMQFKPTEPRTQVEGWDSVLGALASASRLAAGHAGHLEEVYQEVLHFGGRLFAGPAPSGQPQARKTNLKKEENKQGEMGGWG